MGSDAGVRGGLAAGGHSAHLSNVGLHGLHAHFRRSVLKVWPVLGIALLQSFLLFAHWLIGHTLISFLALNHAASTGLWVTLGLLSASFIVATLLGFYHSNFLIGLLYKAAAIWLGFL